MASRASASAMTLPHALHRVVRGTDELAWFCAEVGEYYQGLHFNTVPRLPIDQDVAWGQVHFQWIGIFRSGPVHCGQRHAAGYYHVTYRRLGGGWRIERRIETQINGSVAEAFDPVIAGTNPKAFGETPNMKSLHEWRARDKPLAH